MVAPEVERRLVHASGASVPIAYTFGLVPWTWVQAVFVGGALLALGFEALRLTGTVDLWAFEKLTREYEQDNLAGYALYMLSMGAATLLFDPQVAVPSMLMLALADPVSGLLGSGELRAVKSASVLFVMFAVCALIAWPFVSSPVAIVLGALAATLADGVKPVFRGYVIDDNLTIPLAAGAAMTAALALAL
ncbi:dolichol kinase [Halomarina ordinaria]|uniref:Dolichol kinase n=1 Tax=Halomarina ordinaria TaxID=3033939 RepID=A0ABD5UA56_9EURY|nr:dolichol kinase [Halomarina sp. PSRA2]